MGPNRIVVSEQPQSTTIIELIFTLRPSKWAASTKCHGDIDTTAQYHVRGHLKWPPSFDSLLAFISISKDPLDGTILCKLNCQKGCCQKLSF